MPVHGYSYSYRKIGGLHFIRIGALVLSFCVSRKWGCEDWHSLCWED